MRKLLKKEIGITLIALVITIIVLLILAGVSIAMLTGNNGIFNRARDSKDKTEEGRIIEEARIDILSKLSTNKSVSLTENELRNILEPKYGTVSTTDGKSIIEETLTTTDGKYVITVSEIYNGELKQLTVADCDPKEYYGQFIDYDIDLDGITNDYDWKILYNDGINIYIIAEDNVLMSKCSLVTNSSTGRNEDNSKPYLLGWNWNGGNIPTPSNIKGSENIFTSTPSKTSKLADKFLSNWKGIVTGTNSPSEYSNAKIVAILMDTSLWSNFTESPTVTELTTKADEFAAIGGPTLEMWVNSWNEKYPDERLYCNKASRIGYSYDDEVMTNSGVSYVGQISMREKTAYGDKLYFPHTKDEDEVYSYWMASPSAEGNQKTMYVNSIGNVRGTEYTGRSVAAFVLWFVFHLTLQRLGMQQLKYGI